MKIEEMSAEELVRSLMSFSWVAGSNDESDSGSRYKPELLSRLTRGDKAIEEIKRLRREIADLELDKTIGEAVIAVIKGETVSDFEESFDVIRTAIDVYKRAQDGEKAIKAMEKIDKIYINHRAYDDYVDSVRSIIGQYRRES